MLKGKTKGNSHAIGEIATFFLFSLGSIDSSWGGEEGTSWTGNSFPLAFQSCVQSNCCSKEGQSGSVNIRKNK
jgi:hypothetical protein